MRSLVFRSYYRRNVVGLFEVLSNNTLDQLRELQLDRGWKFSKEALTEFFENWKQQERISLDLYISSYAFGRNNDYEDIIKEYQGMSVIRKFDKYAGTYNILDNWK